MKWDFTGGFIWAHSGGFKNGLNGRPLFGPDVVYVDCNGRNLPKSATDASARRRHYRSPLQVIHFLFPCHAMYPQCEPLFVGFRGAETCNSFDRRQKTLLASGKAQARCC
jgi:hypothetical protein